MASLASSSSTPTSSISSSEDDPSGSFTSSSTSVSSIIETVHTPHSLSYINSDDPLNTGAISLEELCCCVSEEDFIAEQPASIISGWKSRIISQSSSTSSHCHNLDKSLYFALMNSSSSSSSSSSTKLPAARNYSLSRDSNSPRCGSRLSTRSCILSTSSIPIPYSFRHCVDGDLSQYIKEYRKSYTYPNLKEKNQRCTSRTLSGASIRTQVKPRLVTLLNHNVHPHVFSPSALRRKKQNYHHTLSPKPNQQKELRTKKGNKQDDICAVFEANPREEFEFKDSVTVKKRTAPIFVVDFQYSNKDHHSPPSRHRATATSQLSIENAYKSHLKDKTAKKPCGTKSYSTFPTSTTAIDEKSPPVKRTSSPHLVYRAATRPSNKSLSGVLSVSSMNTSTSDDPSADRFFVLSNKSNKAVREFHLQNLGSKSIVYQPKF